VNHLFDAYRAFHEQGFVPIFTNDGFDARMLVEACLAAGVRGIEYTLRRPDAPEMIPWLRRRHPELYLIVGSTLDDDDVTTAMRRRHPALRTLAELDDMGVDGFVSMLGFREATIARYAERRIVIPSAYTPTDALRQVGAGAHFVKFNAGNLDLVRECRKPPTFEFCPVFLSSGVSLAHVPACVEAGGVLLSAGFDLMLRDRPRDMTVAEVTEVLRAYMAAVADARRRAWPAMVQAAGADARTWLATLPHYHPF
jgi:2-keto-3-deoxy-6-phosphogluconate aldolase